MDREALKYGSDGRPSDGIRIRDGETQTIRQRRDGGRGGRGGRGGSEEEGEVTLGGVLLMTNLMEPHFPGAVHLTAPVWTSLPLRPSLSGYYSNYVCLKEADHSAQSPC